MFLLAFTAFAKGYGSSYWLTFNQAKERGGAVRKGEKSSMVVFWKQFEVKNKETGEPEMAFVLRYYNVFNAEQVDGIEIPDAVKFGPLDFHPIDAAEQIAAGYLSGPVSPMTAGSRRFIVLQPIAFISPNKPGLPRRKNIIRRCFTSFRTALGIVRGWIESATPSPNHSAQLITAKRNWSRKCPPPFLRSRWDSTDRHRKPGGLSGWMAQEDQRGQKADHQCCRPGTASR